MMEQITNHALTTPLMPILQHILVCRKLHILFFQTEHAQLYPRWWINNVQYSTRLLWETSHVYFIYCLLYNACSQKNTVIHIGAIMADLLCSSDALFYLTRLGLDGGSADLRLCRRLRDHFIESFTSRGLGLASFYLARMGSLLPLFWKSFLWETALPLPYPAPATDDKNKNCRRRNYAKRGHGTLHFFSTQLTRSPFSILGSLIRQLSGETH